MGQSVFQTCLLVEDHVATRDWLCDVLGEVFSGIEITTAGSVREGLQLLDQWGAAGHRADIALVDLGLPDGSGVQVLRRLVEAAPATRRIVTTAYGDDAYLLEAIAAGAQGYLLKEEEASTLSDTLRRIERDEPPLSPSIARRMLAHFGGGMTAQTAKQDDDLTAREKETLTLLARGYTIAEVADKLGLSPHTVASYAKTIYQKLHVTSRAEATREAIRRGFA